MKPEEIYKQYCLSKNFNFDFDSEYGVYVRGTYEYQIFSLQILLSDMKENIKKNICAAVKFIGFKRGGL